MGARAVSVAVLCAAAITGPVTGSVALHVLQHVALISLLPMLVVWAFPRAWPQRAIAMRAALALVVAALAVVYIAHLPIVFSADQSGLAVRLAVHLALLAAGVAFCLPVSGPRVASGMAAVILIAFTELGIGAIGMYLAWAPQLVYALADGQSSWLGLDPATDQALGGAFLLVIAEPVLAVEVAVLFMRALDEGDR